MENRMKGIMNADPLNKIDQEVINAKFNDNNRLSVIGKLLGFFDNFFQLVLADIMEQFKLNFDADGTENKSNGVGNVIENLSSQIAFITGHYALMKDQLKKLDCLVKEHVHADNTALIGIHQKIYNLLHVNDGNPIANIDSTEVFTEELELLHKDHALITSNVQSVKNYFLEQKVLWAELLEINDTSMKSTSLEEFKCSMKEQSEGSLRCKLQHLHQDLSKITSELSKKKNGKAFAAVRHATKIIQYFLEDINKEYGCETKQVGLSMPVYAVIQDELDVNDNLKRALKKKEIINNLSDNDSKELKIESLVETTAKLRAECEELQNVFNKSTASYKIQIDTLNTKIRMQSDELVERENDLHKYQTVLKELIKKNSSLENELKAVHKKLFHPCKPVEFDNNKNYQAGNFVTSENLLHYFFPKQQ